MSWSTPASRHPGPAAAISPPRTDAPPDAYRCPSTRPFSPSWTAPSARPSHTANGWLTNAWIKAWHSSTNPPPRPDNPARRFRLPRVYASTPGARADSEDVEQDRDEMQQAAGNDEQVPDAMPMTEAAVVGEKNDPDGVEHSACGQPGEARSAQGGN